MLPSSVLVMGGTRDALRLAEQLHERGVDVTTSLAGVTADPRLPPGKLRRGGFGGPSVMADYMRAQGFGAVVDATHPFAAQISHSTYEASRLAGLPYVRLERPGWEPQAGDCWIPVSSVSAAAEVLPPSAKVFLTVGRKSLAAFTARENITGIARMIEPPGAPVPTGWTLLLERPPFEVADEMQLMQLQGISHVVTKNAGGDLTYSKIVAARELSLPVVIIDRPAKPDAPCCPTVQAVVKWLSENI